MKYLVVAAALCFGAALARPDGAGHSHDHSHDHAAAAAPTAPQAPSSGYSAAAASGYSAPGQGYDTPSAYAAPSTGYEQPAAAGYEQPYDQSYAAPTSYGQGYDAPVAAAPAAGPNLGLIIIPLLIVAGLALLFPSTTLVTVRRKRDTEGGELIQYIHHRWKKVTDGQSYWSLHFGLVSFGPFEARV
jgi:hypothetical protein